MGKITRTSRSLLRLPIPFDEAITDLLKVKPEPRSPKKKAAEKRNKK